jgi:hypothetical protein
MLARPQHINTGSISSDLHQQTDPRYIQTQSSLSIKPYFPAKDVPHTLIHFLFYHPPHLSSSIYPFPRHSHFRHREFPLSTDLSSTLAGRADGSDRDTLTVDWSVANTDSDSGSIGPRDPKGGSGGGGKGGGGKSGKSGRKGSREKTNFGKAFKNRFNTKAVKDKFRVCALRGEAPILVEPCGNYSSWSRNCCRTRRGMKDTTKRWKTVWQMLLHLKDLLWTRTRCLPLSKRTMTRLGGWMERKSQLPPRTGRPAGVC